MLNTFVILTVFKMLYSGLLCFLFTIDKKRFLSTGYLPTLYEFHFDGTQEKWVPWSSLVPKYTHDPEMKFSDILGKYYFYER